LPHLLRFCPIAVLGKLIPFFRYLSTNSGMTNVRLRDVAYPIEMQC